MANSDQQSSMKIYVRLLKYVLPYWGAFAVSIVGFVLFASSQPMLADMLKHFLDALQKQQSTNLEAWLRRWLFTNEGVLLAHQQTETN